MNCRYLGSQAESRVLDTNAAHLGGDPGCFAAGAADAPSCSFRTQRAGCGAGLYASDSMTRFRILLTSSLLSYIYIYGVIRSLYQETRAYAIPTILIRTPGRRLKGQF